MNISPELRDKLKDCRLDHIAIAVKSIEEAKLFYEALGLKFVHEEVVEEQLVRTSFAYIDEYAKVELLESTSDQGPIAKHIEKRGPGLHHICFEVLDIRLKQRELELAGIKFLYLDPKTGANNCLVNFIHPKSSGGVLVELSQKKINIINK